MSLEVIQRKDSKYWYAQGYVTINGRKIGDYIRKSTGSLTKEGAKDWIEQRSELERRKYFLGEEHIITFNDAVLLYDPTSENAGYLAKLIPEIGHLALKKITPVMIRDLGPKLYPNLSSDTWKRRVIVPARAVIMRAHDQGLCSSITVKSYSTAVRVKQDQLRGKQSRKAKTPGSWDWLLKFRQKAAPHLAALALFMFTTGTRIGQCIKMHPETHLDLEAGRAFIPAGKGREARWVTLLPELVDELKDLPPKHPRGWDCIPNKLRVFGYASKDGPRNAWNTACDRAGIERITPHGAGRHGFGQEIMVRQGVDKQSVAKVGGWSDPSMLDRVYTHPERSDAKIQKAFRTGLAQAEDETGIKLLKVKGKY